MYQLDVNLDPFLHMFGFLSIATIEQFLFLYKFMLNINIFGRNLWTKSSHYVRSVVAVHSPVSP